MAKRWRLYPHDASRIAQLERNAGISPILAQLLLCRGVCDPGEVRRFLDAKLGDLRDPEELPGIPAAADRISQAIRDRKRIIIYGDYDADGMTATALLFLCLQILNADVGYFVPNRLEEGYGLNGDALRTLRSRGAAMVITVDCGIGSVREAELARELGLELIITDHHEPGPCLPAASAIVHPRLPGSSYPFGELCGAGVAFKLAWALCCRASDSKKVSAPMREFLLSAIGLAALGTVADVVRLVDENRILVRHGLISLRERPARGLQALMQITKLDKKPSLGAEDIAFTLAPRLNAAGRLGQAQLAVELLTTPSQERATALADYIHQLNSSRESLERSVYLGAVKQIKEQFSEDEPAFVLASADWHAGVIGIVAGRLADKFARPVVLISLDELGAKPGCGSGRSAGTVNLHTALGACSQHLVAHGGHAAAAGLKIAPHCVDAFRTEFCEFVAQATSTSDRMAEVVVDGEASFSQLTLMTVQQVESLAPFGHGNSRPVLCATGVRLAEPPKRIGGGERHLSVKLVHHQTPMRGIAFGQGERFDELTQVDGLLDVAYRPVINDFQGRRSVELHLVDWRNSNRAASTLSAVTTIS